MKIAVFHNLPSGGAKRALYEWVKRLSEKHYLDLYSYGSTKEDYLDIRPLVKNVYTYGHTIPASSGYNIFKKLSLFINLSSATKKMAKDIDSRGYDLVFVNHCAYIQSPLILKYVKTPTLYFCQEPFRRVYEPRPWDKTSVKALLKDALLRITDISLKRIDRSNIGAADMILANSNYSKEAIFRIYGKMARLNYLGVDTKNFKRSGRIAKTFRVISVGRLHPSKGFDFIIKSIGHIPEKCRPLLSIISDLSDDRYLTNLRNIANEYHVNCEFISVRAEDMPDIYNSAMLTLYAPVMEPLGLVSLESMACGVPVVGVSEAGVRETVIHGETGLLTERDSVEFSEAILSLITNDHERERMGEVGIIYAEKNWSWEKSTETLEKEMFRLIKGNKYNNTYKGDS